MVGQHVTGTWVVPYCYWDPAPQGRPCLLQRPTSWCYLGICCLLWELCICTLWAKCAQRVCI